MPADVAIGVSLVYVMIKVRDLVSLALVSSVWPFMVASGCAGTAAYHMIFAGRVEAVLKRLDIRSHS